jgi:hypothetical protein
VYLPDASTAVRLNGAASGHLVGQNLRNSCVNKAVAFNELFGLADLRFVTAAA